MHLYELDVFFSKPLAQVHILFWLFISFFYFSYFLILFVLCVFFYIYISCNIIRKVGFLLGGSVIGSVVHILTCSPANQLGVM